MKAFPTVGLLWSLTFSASAHAKTPIPSHPPVSPPKAASAPAKPAVRIFKTDGEHQTTLILHPDGTYWKTFVMSTGGNGVDHMDVEDGKYVLLGRRIVFTNRSGAISKARYSTTRIQFPDAVFHRQR